MAAPREVQKEKEEKKKEEKKKKGTCLLRVLIEESNEVCRWT